MKRLVALVLDVLGPIGCYIIGGGLCLFFIYALIQDFKKPPVHKVLQAEKAKSMSGGKIVLWYGALIFAWFKIVSFF